MTNLESNINKHMIDNFGKSYQYYVNTSEILTNEITPTIFTDVFTKLYLKLYMSDLEFQNIENQFRTALSNDIAALDILSDNYEQVRRVSSGLDLFLRNNRVHNINSSIILQIPEDNDKELETMKTPVILDYADIVMSVIDARSIVDVSTGIQKLYEINYYRKDDNNNRLLSVEYEMYVAKKVRYFETSVTFPKFDVSEIVIYDVDGKVITYKESDIIVEKLRRKINIYFNDPILIKRMVITYQLESDDRYVSLGNAFVSNKNLYTETLESSLLIDREYNVIEFLNHPTYNYMPMNKFNVTIPSIDSENSIKIKKFHILENSDDLLLLLYPIPNDISDVQIFIYNPEFTIIEHSTVGSNMIKISSDTIAKNNLSAGSKIYIKYLSSDNFYEYLDSPYIRDALIFKRSGLEKKMTFKVDIAESSSIRNTFSYLEMYYRSNKYKSLVLEKMQDVIEVNVNWPSDVMTRQTIVAEMPETNIYAYNVYDYQINSQKDSLYITLPRKYIAGMVKVFDSSGVEYNCKDWCDNKALTNSQIEVNNIPIYTNIKIYYSPVDDNSEIISNINNVKSDYMTVTVDNKTIVLNPESLDVDNFIVGSWKQENGSFKNPIYSDIYYEPFFTNDATIEKVYIDDSNQIIIEIKEENVETLVLYYHKKKSFNLVVNPAYTMNGYNPVILVSEY